MVYKKKEPTISSGHTTSEWGERDGPAGLYITPRSSQELLRHSFKYVNRPYVSPPIIAHDLAHPPLFRRRTAGTAVGHLPRPVHVFVMRRKRCFRKTSCSLCRSLVSLSNICPDCTWSPSPSFPPRQFDLLSTLVHFCPDRDHANVRGLSAYHLISCINIQRVGNGMYKI